LKLSRWLTAFWGILLIGIAVLARGWGSVFTTGLTIASLVYGPMLGAFLLGVLTKPANQRGVRAGMALSLAFMLLINFMTSIAWTWYVLMGTAICLTAGYALSLRAPTKGFVAGLVLCTSLVGAFGFAETAPYARFDRQLTKKEVEWVRQTLCKMTLDEKIGQMSTVDINVVFMNRESDEYKQIRDRILDNKPSGLILSRSQG